MDISVFDYDLPPELIAQIPLVERSSSRMMLVIRDTGAYEHSTFGQFKSQLNSGDCLVLNDTKVFPARLLGATRESGGKVEIFLVRPVGLESAGRNSPLRTSQKWIALLKSSGKLKEGELLGFKVKQSDTSVRLERKLENGNWEVSFPSESAFVEISREFGHVPLPPYINRADDNSDIKRYQTVYADDDKPLAVAAPTAGLHFDKKTLESIQSAGVKIVRITLHVGPGTFKPVVVDQIENHRVDPECAEISQAACDTINNTVRSGGKIIAVGTTSMRVLEYVAALDINDNALSPFSGMVDLYIRPGYDFKIVDSLLTNFHLPRSSLLILVGAFAGVEAVRKCYIEAVKEKYRFYSYGDCMFIRSLSTNY
ncbi:MAG: tRNA preQ1(34) S-adenosylmethionine ribosyltransferase-isomerase QueA [candidate division Zixibacteria bacterium]|nr:tRNA preQ1(34) S-adenosylmethionine ribosyltransferase-isomerase QueA [candidate division Zixibacteria bacterium]